MKVAKVLVASLTVGLVFVIGCSGPQSRLPGKWVEEGTKDTENYIEFFSDNTITIKTPDMPMSGKWTILSDGRIKADVEVMFSKITIIGELKGKRLFMDMDGKDATFVKADRNAKSSVLDSMGTPRQEIKDESTKDVLELCQSNLHQLDIALQCHCYPPVEFYPLRLVDLNPDDVAPGTLLCPAMKQSQISGGLPHTLGEMDKYVDYMFLGGASPATHRTIPVLICPPENHGGKGGIVLFGDHSIRWIPSPEIDKLIVRMYAYAETNGLRVVVSEAMTKRSNGRYKSF